MGELEVTSVISFICMNYTCLYACKSCYMHAFDAYNSYNYVTSCFSLCQL